MSIFFLVFFLFLIVFSHASVAQDLEPNYPDLEVLSVGSEFSEDGKEIATITIINSGNVDSGSFLVVVGNSSEGLMGSTIEVLGLKSGENITIKVEIETLYDLEVEVDPENQIEELDEENNFYYSEDNYSIVIGDIAPCARLDDPLSPTSPLESSSSSFLPFNLSTIVFTFTAVLLVIGIGKFFVSRK